MRVGVALCSFWLIAAPALPARASDCLGDGKPDVRALIEARDLDGALALATKNATAAPEDLAAALDVARVRIARAQVPGLVVDFKALGFDVDAKGEPIPGQSREVDPEGMKKHSSERVTLVPGEAQLAEAALEDVVKRWPLQLQAWLCLMDLHQARQDHRGLIEVLERAARALVSLSGIDEDLLRPAVAYMRDQRPDLAIDVYRALHEAFPRSAMITSDLAVATLQLGGLRDARPLFEDAAALDPKDALIARNLGMLCRLLNDLDASARWMSRWRDLAPDDPQPLFELALLAMRNGPKSSIPAWDAYLSSCVAHPDHPSYMANARAIREGLAAGSDDDESLGALAQEFMSQGVGEQALPLVAWLQSRHPAKAWPRYLRAGILDRAGHFDLAVEELGEVLRLLEHDDTSGIVAAEVWMNVARGRYAQQRFADALPWLRKVEAAAPTTKNLHYFLGESLHGVGDDESARRHWKLCVDGASDAEQAEWCRQRLAG